MSEAAMEESKSKGVVRFIINGHVTDIIHKELTIGGKKSADGTAELFTEDAGWYVVIDKFSIFTGNEPPPFKKGQAIRVIIEGSIE